MDKPFFQSNLKHTTNAILGLLFSSRQIFDLWLIKKLYPQKLFPGF